MGTQVTVYWRTTEKEVVENGVARTVTSRDPYFNNMKYVHFPGQAESIRKEMYAPDGILYKHHRSLVIKNFKALKHHKDCYDKIMQSNRLEIVYTEPYIGELSNGNPFRDSGSFCFMTYLFGYYGFRLLYNRPNTDYWEEVLDMSEIENAARRVKTNYYASEYSLGLMNDFIKKVKKGDAKGEESWSPPAPK